jgi:hypothetical protein
LAQARSAATDRNSSGAARSIVGPGQADFTFEEWATPQQATMACGVLVWLAEGTVEADEIFALTNKLRQASIAHPRRFVRELTAASTFNTGLRRPSVNLTALQAAGASAWRVVAIS